MDNPPAPGFDVEGSDAQAIELADRVMEAMGGRDAWDRTRYIGWRFFGVRDHVWDRYTGDIRFQQGPRLVLMNINTKEGRAWNNGTALEGDELAKALKDGYEAWVNDSYWLVMPYKLKDSGVTLKYVGEGETDEGSAADMIQMTFKGVGVTPQNKYHVWVGRESGLVEQWAYFPTAADEAPQFKTPWAEWKQYKNVKISGSRGTEGRFATAIADIKVWDDVPRTVFESPEDVKLP